MASDATRPGPDPGPQGAADAARPARPAAAVFIIITIALDAMGIGLILPVLPEVLRDIAGVEVSEAAAWGALLSFSFAGMTFLMSPLIGGLSDRYGRRPVLLISLGALCLDYIVVALANTLWLLFLTRIVAGACAATYSTANAYLADVSPPEKRAANFGLVGAGFGVGFVLGPAAGGLLGELGPRAPFVAAAILAGLNMLFGLLVLPESLPKARRRPVDLGKLDPFRALRDAARLPGLAGLLAAMFIYSLAHSVYPAIWSYYALAQFGWTPGQIGLSLAAVGVAMALGQGLLIRWMLRRFKEPGTILLGIAANVISMLALVAPPGGWVVYAFLPLLGVGIVTGPAINGLMSARTPDDAQGRLQGVVGSLQGVTSILAPLLFGGVFWLTTHEGAALVLPGAPFAIAALLTLLAAVPILRALRGGPGAPAAQSKR
ncbi:MAG: TCR/Tet family MFS transporter [Pseudomonadota bacterium]